MKNPEPVIHKSEFIYVVYVIDYDSDEIKGEMKLAGQDL